MMQTRTDSAANKPRKENTNLPEVIKNLSTRLSSRIPSRLKVWTGRREILPSHSSSSLNQPDDDTASRSHARSSFLVPDRTGRNLESSTRLPAGIKQMIYDNDNKGLYGISDSKVFRWDWDCRLRDENLDRRTCTVRNLKRIASMSSFVVAACLSPTLTTATLYRKIAQTLRIKTLRKRVQVSQFVRRFVHN
eukprot:c10371_g1_i1.p1 GENE.c10371_g1_i1~~c10371_g1_i1.p1  ORF type:complete len:209 (+),score=21.82 c10371_g1_i1:53-628(+)